MANGKKSLEDIFSAEPAAPKPSLENIFAEPAAPEAPQPAAELQLGGPAASPDPVQAAIDSGQLDSTSFLDAARSAVEDVAASDIRSAFGKGFAKAPEFRIARGLQKRGAISEDAVTGGFLGREVKRAEEAGFEPKTVTEKVIAEGTQFLTPAALLGGNLLRGLKLAKNIDKAKTLVQGIQSGAAGLGLQAAGEQAVVSAAEQFEEQKFEPGRLAKDVATAGAVGAVFGGALGPLAAGQARRAKLKNIKQKRRVQKTFEADTAAPLPQTDLAKQAEAKSLGRQLSQVDQLQARNAARLAQPDIDSGVRRQLTERNARIDAVKKSIENRAGQLAEPEAVNSFRQARNLSQDATVNIRGKQVPLFDESLSKTGRFVPESEIAVLSKADDISSREAGIFTLKDYPRLLEQADKSVRGPLKRMLLEPLEASATKTVNEKAAIEEVMLEKFRPISNTYKQRKEALFDFAEGKNVQLSAPEKDFMNTMAKQYSDLIDGINEVHLRNGLEPVKKRKNYITHLTELNDLAESGVEVGSSEFARATKTPFRFAKARTGAEEIIKDPLKSFDAYLEPALRRKNMTDVGADILERSKFLPPNLRKAVTDIVDKQVLGNKPTLDKVILDAVPKKWVDRIETTNNQMIKSIIVASLNVAGQQASQVIPTALQTGTKFALRGLAQAAKEPPAHLMKMSRFLPQRSIKNEFKAVSLAGKLNRNPLSMALDVVDMADKVVARQSWNSAFLQAKEKFLLSDRAAVEYADDIARRLHAQYQDLYRTKALRSRAGKFAFPFQTFVANQVNFVLNDTANLARLRGTTQAKEVIRVLGGLLATNQVMHMMGLPTPFGKLVPSEIAEDIRQAPTAGQVADIAVGVGREVSQQVPFLGNLAFEGTNLPVASPSIQFIAGEVADPVFGSDFVKGKSALQELWTAIGEDDPDERSRRILRAAKKGPLRFVTGGRQISNIMEGLDTARKGFWKVGTEEVDFDKVDSVIGTIFGPSKAPAAKRFFREKEQERRENQED